MTRKDDPRDERTEEQQDVTRRDAVKLSAAVAALCAGLGVVLDPAAASAAAMQHQKEPVQITQTGGLKASPEHIELRLYAPTGPGGGKRKLVAILRASPATTQRILAASGAALQLQVVLANYRDPRLQTPAGVGRNVLLASEELKLNTGGLRLSEAPRGSEPPAG